MTKALTQKEQVTVFACYQQSHAVSVLSGALDMIGGTTCSQLRDL